MSKSKGKGKKPSIDVQGAEGIVDLNGMQQKMQDVIDEMGQELATKVPLRITTGNLRHFYDTKNCQITILYMMSFIQAKSLVVWDTVNSPFVNHKRKDINSH